jgi:hypothetical protein
MRISWWVAGLLVATGAAMGSAMDDPYTGASPNEYRGLNPSSPAYLRLLNEKLRRGDITLDQYNRAQNNVMHDVQAPGGDLPTPPDNTMDTNPLADPLPTVSLLDDQSTQTESLLPNEAASFTAAERASHRKLMDAWLNFVARNYQSGESAEGKKGRSGFVGGGQKYRNNLQPVANAFGAAMGISPKAVGDDRIDFGDGFGAIDVITASGDWWYSD